MIPAALAHAVVVGVDRAGRDEVLDYLAQHGDELVRLRDVVEMLRLARLITKQEDAPRAPH